MADEKIAQIVLGLQLAQQVHDLRLHRHVEGRGGFVQHDEFGFEGKRTRDGNTLALAA